MAKSKPFSLSGMVDTDAEEETVNVNALTTPESNPENKGAKRKGGRPKANAKRFTKPKRLSGGSVTAKPATATNPKAGRKKAPLKEQASAQNADDEDDLDEIAQAGNEVVIDRSTEPKPGAKRKAAEKPSERPAKARAIARFGGSEKDGEFEYTPTAIRQSKGVRKTHAAKFHALKAAEAAALSPETEIPETQVPANVNTSSGQEDDEQETENMPESILRRSNNARAASKQRQPSVVRRRAGSVSDPERTAGDPALRRRLGDMTRKFERADLKYRNLKEVGVKEAEVNYEKLKKQSDINAKAANDLITSLKAEIATQKSIAREAQSFKSQAQSRETDLSKTRELADQLSKSLAGVENDNKILQAKLANSRSASIAVDRTPGSAMRNRNQAQPRSIATANSNMTQAAQIAQLKEDLYSDLTGLILRSVDMGTESDTFDCIQTGRNGTLHFKLAVAKDPDETYENTEFQYTPRLDSDRDGPLIELLPEYLTDEIAFSRMNAAMFYGRVVQTMTKRRSAEDQD